MGPAQPLTQPRLSLSTSLCRRKLTTLTWSEAAPTTPPPSLIVHPASTIILDNEEVLGDEDGDLTFASLFPTKWLSSLSVKNQRVIFYVYFCHVEIWNYKLRSCK